MVLDAEIDQIIVVAVAPDHNVQKVLKAKRGGSEDEEVLSDRNELVTEQGVLFDEGGDGFSAPIRQIILHRHVSVVPPSHEHEWSFGLH